VRGKIEKVPLSPLMNLKDKVPRLGLVDLLDHPSGQQSSYFDYDLLKLVCAESHPLTLFITI
jgi:hypothetical protein